MGEQPESRNTPETLLRLHETAWANFRDRRSYEWKVSFGIWTFLAVLTAAAIRGNVTRLPSNWRWIGGSVVFAFILWLLHLLFECRLAQAHKADTAKAYLYEKLLNDTLLLYPGSKCEARVVFELNKSVCYYHERAQKAIAKVQKRPWHKDVREDMFKDLRGVFFHKAWSHVRFHVATTALLMVIAFMALFLPIWQDKNDTAGSRLVTARTFKVKQIVDGDTFKIDYDGDLTSVRLHGIDAPEPNTPEGSAATDALAKLIEGKVVRIDFPGPRKRDKVGWLLCDVHVEGAVGAEMKRQGHAKPYVPSR